MSTSLSPSVEVLLQRAAEGLRAYMATDGPARTLAAKAAAEALVEARPLFQARDGSPDLLGRSSAYRAFVTQAQDEAGVPRDDRASVQAAIRYHVSPLLRERYAEEVEALGLSAGSSVERGRRRKERDSRVVTLFAGGSELSDAADLSLVANLARLGVSRVAGWPTGTSEHQRKRIREEFENLAAAVAGALDRLS
ncbi:hypothetical protein J2Y69_003356 [Microbacterium resistens]|uniref:Uncharacterized protein n=1 Tax=Microbacterium resistens TaxID=156977 RepID=A0ABU1SIM6_9MICO|nr:hypothetical protein [Microbacterium resistens]MDR6868732.1 hypothetical protein [Microbacterium resistens]